MLTPGTWHRYRPDSESGWDEYWIGFSGSHISELMKRQFFSSRQALYTINSKRTIVNLFQDCLKQLHDERIGFQQIVSSRVIALLAEIHSANQLPQKNASHIESIVQEGKQYLDKHPDELIDMQHLAKELNVSYDYFRRQFKLITGLPPHQYHLLLKINRAKELLSATNTSIKEIAATLNFDTPFYFSRKFKEKTSLSPKAFRQLSRK